MAADVDRAPGWDAIEAAFTRLHPGQAGGLNFRTGGKAARGPSVWAVSAYAATAHWHLVTLGLSELWQKHSANPAVSGWGFELTLKAPLMADETSPPHWSINLLKVVGDSVFQTGRPLAEGSRLDIGAPVTGRILSRLVALALVPDEEVPAIETDNGRVEFLQVVGITRTELERMQESSTEAVIAEMRATDPLLLTDPAR